MAQTEATLDQIAQAASFIDDKSAAINALINSIGNHVAATAGAWRGAAAVSFADVMARYNGSAIRLREALAEISAGVRSNGQRYDHAESDNASALTTVGGSLNLT